jgi:hypothetical protein
MRETKKRVIIMGGLGNQLFQYSFALSYAIKNNVTINLDPNFAAIRINAEGMTDLSSYQLNEMVQVAEFTRYPSILRKIIGLGIRLNIERDGFSRSFIGISFHLVTNLLCSLYFRQKCVLYFADDNGFSNINEKKKYTTYVGYFQSYLFADTEKATVRELAPIKPVEKFKYYMERAQTDKPLIVHIRLTDYRNEPKFGIPSREYYFEAIKLQFETSRYKRIWLFSDEPFEAMSFIPPKFHEITDNVSEDISGTVESLEVMRLGAGYVLANSTFSWWGAFLSYSNDPFVVYPAPWFAGMPEPSHLCPPQWLPVKR